MSGFIHTIHQYLIYIAKYMVILTVIGFMPVPLFTFLGGTHLSQQDYHPIFEYFQHYEIDTESILENTYTNYFISKKGQQVAEYQIENAIVFADYLAYDLIQLEVPVAKSIISTKGSKLNSLKYLHQQMKENDQHNSDLGNIVLDLKVKFEKLLPIQSITEEARQWIILALGASESAVKKEIKTLSKQFPDDNFLVISQHPMKIHKRVHQVQIPDFNIKEAKQVLSESLKITEIQAELFLMHFDKSLWQLERQNDQSGEFTMQSLLGDAYESFDQEDLTKKQRKVLEELCSSGKAKEAKYDLRDWGVEKKAKYFKWENKLSQLNYQLAHEVSCGQPFIDIQISQPSVNPDELVKQGQQEVKQTKEQVEKEGQKEVLGGDQLNSTEQVKHQNEKQNQTFVASDQDEVVEEKTTQEL